MNAILILGLYTDQSKKYKLFAQILYNSNLILNLIFQWIEFKND